MKWQDILNEVPNDKRWVARYIKFIQWCISTEVDNGEYTESHHILPKSLFPDYRDFKLHHWNKIVLTARQHFVAHYILAKAYGGPMWYAYNMMINCDEFGKRKYIIGSVFYKNSRIRHSREVSKQSSGENNYWYGKDRSGDKNPMYGRTQSDETKRKISEANKLRLSDDENRKKFQGENNGMFGKTHTKETIDKMLESRKSTFETLPDDHYLKRKPDSTKKKMSEARKNADYVHVITIDGYRMIPSSSLSNYFHRNGYYFDYQDGKHDKNSIETYKNKISKKGIKNSEKAKRNKSEARLGTKRIYRKNGSFFLSKNKDQYFCRDGKYYDYEDFNV